MLSVYPRRLTEGKGYIAIFAEIQLRYVQLHFLAVSGNSCRNRCFRQSGRCRLGTIRIFLRGYFGIPDTSGAGVDGVPVEPPPEDEPPPPELPGPGAPVSCRSTFAVPSSP